MYVQYVLYVLYAQYIQYVLYAQYVLYVLYVQDVQYVQRGALGPMYSMSNTSREERWDPPLVRQTLGSQVLRIPKNFKNSRNHGFMPARAHEL